MPPTHKFAGRADVVRYARASRRFPQISIPSCPADNVDRMVLPKEAGGNAGNPRRLEPPPRAAWAAAGGIIWRVRPPRGRLGVSAASMGIARRGNPVHPRARGALPSARGATPPTCPVAPSPAVDSALAVTIRLLSVTDEGHRASEHDQRLVCSTHHCTKLSSSMEPCWCGSSRRMAAMCTRSSSGA